MLFLFFFFNDTATTEIYPLSLHDALPISPTCAPRSTRPSTICPRTSTSRRCKSCLRSEEHTSELQSHSDLVCRLLLEKKKKNHILASTGLAIQASCVSVNGTLSQWSIDER